MRHYNIAGIRIFARSSLVIAAMGMMLTIGGIVTAHTEIGDPIPPSKPGDYRSVSNAAFAMGEKLSFDISYGFITAGQATMSIPDYKYLSGRQTFETRIDATSNPSFDWIFKVRDRYSTFMDVNGIFPWRFEQHQREGNYSHDYSASFDPFERTAETNEGKKFTIPPYVHDIVSAFYYVRTLDLTHMHRGTKIQLQNFYDDKTNPLDVMIMGHQRVTTDLGTFNCVVIQPMVVEGGLFKSEGSITIWLTDDANHIPIKMSSKIIIGSIDVVLTKYEGLRGALTAKVD